MDFTLQIYTDLLSALKQQGYSFITFREYFSNPPEKFVILRHDVDDKKLNSLRFAEIQNQLNVKGTYYFRMVPESFDASVIRKMADLGHEIGYHYEDMDFARKSHPNLKQESQLYDHAYILFQEHLKTLRAICPIDTICMHGSPLSGFDNKALWKKFAYKESGILGEPYFDLDFNQVFYITDTGRMWDGNKVSVRDKVDLPTHFKHLRFHTTTDIIQAIRADQLPNKVMFTFHPQRWTDNTLEWTSEWVRQNAKNFIKRHFLVKSPSTLKP